MLRGRAPAAVALHTARPVLAVGGLGDTVEQKVTGRVARKEVQVAVPAEPGDLEIDIPDPLLIGEDPEIVDLPLVFIDRGRGEVGDTVHRKPQARGLAGDLRDLILTA